MSRSYRKNPYSGCPKQGDMKNYANRVIRRRPIDEEIPDGGRYKRYLCSWDICDYGGLGPTWTQVKAEQDNGYNDRFYPFRADWNAHKEGRKVTEKDIYREYYIRYRAK